MAILNDSAVFIHQNPDHQKAFVNHSARRMLLPSGLALYKFTGAGVIPERSGAYSPWWAPVEPLPGTTDIGLDGHIAAAKAAGLPMLTYARENFAVMLSWNSLGIPQFGMAKVVHMNLTQAVYGFGGLCQRMRETIPPNRKIIGHANKSPLNPPIFRGGAFQLYIPNLTAAYVQAGATNLIE